MNLRRVIIAVLIFTALSYYYFHHIVPEQIQKKNEAIKAGKIILFPEEAHFNYLSIQTKRLQTTIILNEEGEWIITEPINVKADQFMVNNLVATMRLDKKVREFNEKIDFDLEAIGLKKDAMRIGIGYDDVRTYLLIGDETRIGGYFYARWENNYEVFLVSQNFKSAFEKDLYSLRNKNIIDFNESDVTHVKVRLTSDIVLDRDVKNENAWWIIEPVENKAKPEAVRTLLESIRKIIPIRFIDAELGEDVQEKFAKTKKSISLVQGDVKTELRLFLKEEDDRYYHAWMSGYPYAFTLAREYIDSLSHDEDYYVDTRIQFFDVSSVQEMRYIKEDRRDVMRIRKNRWEVIEPSRKTGKDFGEHIMKSLQLLAGLEYKTIVSLESDLAQMIVSQAPEFSIQVSNLESGKDYIYDFYIFEGYYVVGVYDDPNYYTIQPERYSELIEILKHIV